MIKVIKFGGSSLANSEQFKKVKKIVQEDKTRKYVVVSAPGKANKSDNKITDLLYLLDAHKKYHVDGRNVFEIIKKRYLSIKEDLGLTQDIETELEEMYTNLDKLSQSEIVSRGEYFCAKLLAEYLGYNFVDSKDNIIFNMDHSVNMELSSEKIKATLEANDNFVFPGFYGSTINHQIMLFPRGGSDITGSILANILEADVYENWTDVSGFLMADPRIVDNPKGIKTISYTELRELSYMGANVLHDEAIFPVRESNIPIHIKNTNAPKDPGTIIQEKSDNPYDITGIAGKKGFSSINFFKKHMSNENGYLRKVLTICESFSIHVQYIPSGIDTFSVVVERKEIENCEYELLAKIKQELDPDKMNITNDLALISTVGRNMSKRPGTSGKLFNALGVNGINIAMISQGADEINITVGVKEDDFNKTIKVIYNTFVKE